METKKCRRIHAGFKLLPDKRGCVDGSFGITSENE